MANVNRWISGRNNSPNIVLLDTSSGVTIEKGDMLFLDDSDGLRAIGTSTKDLKIYPLSYIRVAGSSIALDKANIKDHFMGIAVSSKDGTMDFEGVKVSVATSGIFSMDLKPARTVYPGNYVGASGTTSVSKLFNQKVMVTSNVTDAIGIVAERKVHAKECDIFIRPAYGPGALVS